LRAGKRISVIEDTAVSPTERLRLINIDSSQFVMLSAKGQPPVLIPFSFSTKTPAVSGTPSISMGLADIDEPTKMSVESPKANTEGSTSYPSLAEQAAFVEKFQSWRRDHAAG